MTGQPLSIGDKLRREFDFPGSDLAPHLRIRHLGAFWPHWSLHKRKCDKTGRDIVSVFSSDCSYPVWHKDEWYESAQPPTAVIDFNEPFFSQAEKLFKQCPIAHNTGTHNENSEYVDDFWYGRDCYLCHNAFKCENCRYIGARTLETKDSLYCAFSTGLEKCIDAVNCEKCHTIVYSLYLKNCRDMAFCYDCRNCSDCFFCFNLRHKQYCFGNKQLTREQFEAQKKQFEYATLAGYIQRKTQFQKMMREIAWHRCQYVDLCESSTGNFITQLKNCEHTFFYSQGEDACNTIRGTDAKTLLDTASAAVECERLCHCSAVQIQCYDVRCSFQLTEARFVDYSAYSAQIENCFGCAGLVKGKKCIMNTPYSTEEYGSLKKKITDHMKSTDEWGQFFPGSFAPNPYDESWSSFYFPLSQTEQEKLGLFFLPNTEKHNASYVNISELPPTASEASEDTTKQTWWDELAQKPFQILPQDINFCRELQVALPHTYYMRRIQENFRWMPYNGVLRTTKCAKSGKEIHTSWPDEYEGRILSEEEYVKMVG